MSRHYEFLSDSAEVIREPVELDTLFEAWDAPWGTVALVMGDPYDAAGVLTGTPDQIVSHLEALIALVRQADLPPLPDYHKDGAKYT